MTEKLKQYRSTWQACIKADVIFLKAKKCLHALPNLLASMPFAIAILAFVAVASIIGTILKQNETLPSYVAHFGPFWAQFFLDLGLDSIYRSHWFLLLLTFLVLSTALCVMRNAPKLLQEVGGKSLQRLLDATYWPYRHEWSVASNDQPALKQSLPHLLQKEGFLVTTQGCQDDYKIAAKSKGLTKLGYVATHLAIVLICLGGLIDANPVLKFHELLGSKAPAPAAAIEDETVPRQSLLGQNNPAFRASILLPEGSSTQYAFINRGDKMYVQELPFKINLIKFYTEFYPTGQPKKFASQIEIIDEERGKRFSKTIAVNDPLTYRGITLYQASFGDGGTKLSLLAWPLVGSGTKPLELKGVVNGMTALQGATIEWRDFRLYNVENVSNDPNQKKWQNLGPAMVYRWRKPTGEAREYFNYMAPIAIGNRWYYVSGVREAPNEPYAYWRVPLDHARKIDTFMQVKNAWQDPVMRQKIAAQVAEISTRDPETQAILAQSLSTLMSAIMQQGLLPTLDGVLEKAPATEKEGLASAYLKLLWQTVAISLEQNGREEAKDAPFIEDCLYALGQLPLYGMPFYLQLDRFEQVQASGIQLTRAPGTFMVYLGAFFLVLGVFAQFFLTENCLLVILSDHKAMIHMAVEDQYLLQKIKRLLGEPSWPIQNTS